MTREEENKIIEQAISIIQRRMERGEKKEFTSPNSVKNYYYMKHRERKNEVFSVLFLDTRHRLIADEDMFFGTVDGSSVHPRVIVQRALELNASAVIFAHNHPSGVAEPSAADHAITYKLRDALSLVDVRVLDHIVVGDEVTSFAERGLL